MISNPEIEIRLERIRVELRQLRRDVAGRPDSYEPGALLGDMDTRIEFAEKTIIGAIGSLQAGSDRPAMREDPELSYAVSRNWWV